MIGIALNRTWQQLLHPKFRRVFLTAVLVALATLSALYYALYYFWPDDYTTGFAWIDSAGFILAMILGAYILFPPIATLVMGVMADGIVTAVEEEYYPHRVGPRKVGFLESLSGALKLALMMILLNLLALIPYLLLLFTTAGVGTLGLFIAINGYLLGREYFEMVAGRHMQPKAVRYLQQRHSGRVFTAGAVIAGLFAVPFLNILAPILGAAVMTHIFQHILAGEKA